MMTPEDAKEMYGADATEWLKRWDDGRTVWSIEMGGLGPGYEQAIQITVAEILRFLISKEYDTTYFDEDDKWKELCAEIQEMSFANPIIAKLGLSGAQYVAAKQLAARLYRFGPVGVMTDDRVKDRHIQVNRIFPKG